MGSYRWACGACKGTGKNLYFTMKEAMESGKQHVRSMRGHGKGEGHAHELIVVMPDAELRWFVCSNGHRRYRSNADRPLYGTCPECKSTGNLEGYVP